MYTLLNILLLGVCICVALGANSLDTGSDTTGSYFREHNGRRLESVNAKRGEFPFFSHWGGCGATLVWEDVLLTSAGCNIVESNSVDVGALVSNDNQDGSVRRKIVSRHPHPEFNSTTLENNFMLLKLDKPVAKPTVLLTPTAEIPENAELYVVGFDFTAPLLRVHQIYSRTFHHTLLKRPNLLQQVNDVGINGKTNELLLQKSRMKLVSHAMCNAYDQYAGFIDGESMICANDERSTCLGDNGGPLCMMVNKRCVQIGVVAFGESCATSNRPMVYSSTAPAYGWIQKMICTLSENSPSICQASIKSEEPTMGRQESMYGSKILPYRGSYESVIAVKAPSSAPSKTPIIVRSDAPSDAPSDVRSVDETDKPSANKQFANMRQSYSSEKNYNFGDNSIDATIAPTKKYNKYAARNSNRYLEDSSFFDLKDAPMGFFRLPEDPNTIMAGNSFSDTMNIENRNPSVSSSTIFESDTFDTSTDSPSSDERFSFEGLFEDGLFDIDAGSSSSDSAVNERSNLSGNISQPGASQSSPNPLSQKLGMCQGDCDSDEDCEEGLYCFFKDAGVTSVPGCGGFDDSRTDFCTNKIETAPTQKLGMCEGDCDSDEDCEEGLYCFFKDTDVTSVPGCGGFDDSRTDYCTNKIETTPTFQQPFPMLYVFPENPPDISNYPLQRCQGDCDSDDDCADGLICYERPPWRYRIPGCSGESMTRTDFCIDPNWSRYTPRNDPPVTSSRSDPTWSPTTFSTTLSPTSFPSTAPSQRLTSDPTFLLTVIRSVATSNPTLSPTSLPPLKVRTEEDTTTQFATKSPMQAPTPSPIQSTRHPTPFPSKPRTKQPTMIPTPFPSKPRTSPPTIVPTPLPTKRPTQKPRTKRPTQVPSQPMNADSQSSVFITLAIYFDPWPQEVSWKIERESDGVLIASVSAGTYKSPQDRTLEVMPLRAGETYVLTLMDAGGDGIAGVGSLYEIYLTDQPSTILLDGDGVFDDSHSAVFYVPTTDQFPSSAPSKTTISPAPTIQSTKVYLIIIFDNWHQETSWSISDKDSPSIVFAEAAYDTYRAGESVEEEIKLPVGRSYTFTIRDFFNDGIKNGEYLLMAEDGTEIFRGDGDFGASRSHTFQT